MCALSLHFGPDKCSFHSFLGSFLASRDFYHLLITFANSLDPDQDQLFVSHDLDPNLVTRISKEMCHWNRYILLHGDNMIMVSF